MRRTGSSAMRSEQDVTRPRRLGAGGLRPYPIHCILGVWRSLHQAGRGHGWRDGAMERASHVCLRGIVRRIEILASENLRAAGSLAWSKWLYARALVPGKGWLGWLGSIKTITVRHGVMSKFLGRGVQAVYLCRQSAGAKEMRGPGWSRWESFENT